VDGEGAVAQHRLIRPELKDETIHIRIAGVDAPEAAHFGNPAQPHSQESLDWLRGTIMGKSMSCQLLRKDQYNRIVRRRGASQYYFSTHDAAYLCHDLRSWCGPGMAP
jgi:hypothetical protein